MSQPPSFADPKKPKYVCKLQKVIYDLKQTPRAWYKALSYFLISYGFSNSKADTSLFIYVNDSLIAYMYVFVDDTILTGNNEKFIMQFISALSKEFPLKDLGSLHYFLYIKVVPTS